MTDSATAAALDLDAWLPDPAIVTRHRRAAAADPDALWAAARGLRLNDTRTIGRLVRWRIPGVPADQSFMRLLAEDPFTVLDEGGHHSISGLCGRIWTLQRDYARLTGPEDFVAWNAPRTVRVLFAHWVTDDGNGRATLHSEARVGPTDRVAAMRLRALWLAVGPFERLIGAEPLALAAARAESAAARR
ncbi:MAG TPA: hypothetical protein VG474_06015 [Solirubrobacteraceae bacterium]|nr:hypothetical protein [Solirubrobacteraceae bacterium]